MSYLSIPTKVPWCRCLDTGHVRPQHWLRAQSEKAKSLYNLLSEWYQEKSVVEGRQGIQLAARSCWLWDLAAQVMLRVEFIPSWSVPGHEGGRGGNLAYMYVSLKAAQGRH